MGVSNIPNIESKTTEIEEFIKGVGESPKPVNDKNDELKNVKLRLRESLLSQIDKAVEKRQPKPSRHQWIMEALFLKLESENSEMKLML